MDAALATATGVAYALLARAKDDDEDERESATASASTKGASGTKTASASASSKSSKVDKYAAQANQWINTHVSLVIASCLVGLASIIFILLGSWWYLKIKHRRQQLAENNAELEAGREELEKAGMSNASMPGEQVPGGTYPHFGAAQPPEVQVTLAEDQYESDPYYDGSALKPGGGAGGGGYSIDTISERTEEQDYNSRGGYNARVENDDEEDLNSPLDRVPPPAGQYHQQQQRELQQQRRPQSPPEYVADSRGLSSPMTHSRGLSDPRDAYYGSAPGSGIPQPHAANEPAHLQERDSMYSIQEQTKYA